MKIVLLISLFITLTFVSCGPRSGVPDDKKAEPVCGVQDQILADTNKIIPKTKSEINGQKLFILQCRQCHAPLKIQPSYGGSLQGILDRIPGPPEKYFATFVKDSYALKKSGDAYANKVDEQANVDYEHKFKNVLRDKEIRDIEDYIRLFSRPVE